MDGAILVALLCAFISDKLGDVYYISSGVLSASIAVPALFVGYVIIGLKSRKTRYLKWHNEVAAFVIAIACAYMFFWPGF